MNKTKSKHTQGPWTVQEQYGLYSIVGPDWRGPDMEAICVTKRGYIEEVERANAHLISAAPDLLEAAKEIMSRSGTTCGGPNTEAACHVCSYCKMKAAIVKAEEQNENHT